MLLNTIILSISSSIDSLGIGVTYGIKGTLISKLGKLILFIITFFVTTISLVFGNIIKMMLPTYLMSIIGSLILIFIGIFIILQSLKKDHISFDFDSSNFIDSKEALFLALALSLDSFCIGIGSTIIGISNILFPLLIAIFQLFFLSLGILLGRCLHNFEHLPNNIYSIISGALLIFIGIIKFLL